MLTSTQWVPLPLRSDNRSQKKETVIQTLIANEIGGKQRDSITFARLVQKGDMTPLCNHIMPLPTLMNYLEQKQPISSLCYKCKLMNPHVNGSILPIGMKDDAPNKKVKITDESDENIRFDRWMRNGVEFKIKQVISANSLSEEEKKRISSFCKSLDLGDAVLEEFDSFDDGISKKIIVRHASRKTIVGFCTYRYEDFNFQATTRYTLQYINDHENMLKELQDANKLLLKNIYFIDACIQLIKTAVSKHILAEELFADDAKTKFKQMELYKIIKNQILMRISGISQQNSLLQPSQKDINSLINWLFDYAAMIIHENNREILLDHGEVVNLVMATTCIDPVYSSYGILKGMLRYFVDKAAKKAKKKETMNAFVIVESPREQVELYEALGFTQDAIRMNDSVMPLLMSPNLIREFYLLRIENQDRRL